MNDLDWRGFIQDAIRNRQVQMIRLCVQDLSNISRSRYVSVRHFLEQVGKDNLTLPSALFSLDTSATLRPELGTGFAGGYPSWTVQPDLSTFSVLPYAPGVARIISDVYSETGEPIRSAPRHVLRGVLERLGEHGYRVRGSFEFEFYVFRQTAAGLVPVWDGLQCFSETRQAEVEELILELVRHLSEMGAGPEMANTEYGSGQFEISNSPFWDMEIADMAFYYRSSIKEVLGKRGYVTSFMSKPRNDMSGSGAHLHHSLYDHAGNNVFHNPASPDGLSQEARWFIGGQLYHARTLTALSNATVNSYKRLQPYTFAPSTATWGYEHRGAMIRVPKTRGENTRLENRLPGADTDPYLSLAAILAAGLDGIERQLEPAPALTGEDAYASNWPVLPRSLGEALDALEQDEWAHAVFGNDLMSEFVKLHRTEYNRFLQHVTDWETKEYQEM